MSGHRAGLLPASYVLSAHLADEHGCATEDEDTGRMVVCEPCASRSLALAAALDHEELLIGAPGKVERRTEWRVLYEDGTSRNCLREVAFDRASPQHGDLVQRRHVVTVTSEWKTFEP